MKNPHAVALGRLGGSANTEKQRRARRSPKKGGKVKLGRPVKLCSECGRAGREHRWYRGAKHCPER